ncbi:MAG: hypothetical protein KTR16_10250 [Acidiferrobacterales bacterium]|nr:hypothetical protein [Acidiferrobacterales bacterium]
MKQNQFQSLTLKGCILSYRSPLLIHAVNDDDYRNSIAALNYERKAIVAYDRALNKLNMAWVHAQQSVENDSQAKQEEYELAARNLFSRAIDCFNEAIRGDFDLVSEFDRRGLSLGNTDVLSNSLAAYERALSVRSNYFETIVNLAARQLSKGQFNKVQRTYVRLDREQPIYAEKLKEVISDWQSNLSKLDRDTLDFDRWLLKQY